MGQLNNTRGAVAQPAAPTTPTATPAKKKPRRKIKVTSAADRPAILEEFKQCARERGYRSITVANLLARFGYQKRSEANMKFITESLAEHHLTVHPRLSLDLKLSQSIRIYGFPVVQLGDLFEDPETAPTAAIRKQRERELEAYIERHDMFHELGLKLGCRQYSPKHTQDKFDFLCNDAKKAGTAVVLELKHAGGGKSAVEQVLRYLGMLRQENPTRPARGILVTGVRDVDTAKALHGMTHAQQQEIDWYLYNYNRKTGTLTFEQVRYDFIAEHLHRAHSASAD